MNMRHVLKEVSKTSIKLADVRFSEGQVRTNWLGNEPTPYEAIV